MDSETEEVLIQDGGEREEGRGSADGDGAAGGGDSAARDNPPPTDNAPKTKRIRTSPVWDHFEMTANPRIVQCKHCEKTVIAFC